MKLLNFVLIALLSFFSITSADTMNSIEKNPSMAVTGTQRVSAVITDYVIPNAVSGAACNSVTDTVAVTSDHSSQLICQSGTWQTYGFGYGQTWQDLTTVRTAGLNYINLTGRPILVTVFSSPGTDVNSALIVNGVYVAYNRVYGVSQAITYATAIIPPNGVYSSQFAFSAWVELR